MKKIICAIILLLAVSTAASAAVTIKLRRDTAANWTTNSTVVLAAGEMGVETDTLRTKIGDGVTAWSALSYATEPGGTKEVGWLVKNSATATAVEDGTEAFVVPASMNGMNLVDVTCSVADLNGAASGETTVVLRRVRSATAVDMTSTGVTITYTDYTASDETVDTANDDLATGDKVYVDVNAVTSAAHKGLGCTAMFRLP